MQVKSDPPPTSDFLLLNAKLTEKFPDEKEDDIYAVTKFIYQNVPRGMREDIDTWCYRGVEYCLNK